jgi:hypothetical protein
VPATNLHRAGHNHTPSLAIGQKPLESRIDTPPLFQSFFSASASLLEEIVTFGSLQLEDSHVRILEGCDHEHNPLMAIMQGIR